MVPRLERTPTTKPFSKSELSVLAAGEGAGRVAGSGTDLPKGPGDAAREGPGRLRQGYPGRVKDPGCDPLKRNRSGPGRSGEGPNPGQWPSRRKWT